MRARRRAARGYTIVELLMSLTVLALGTTGVIAMQKVTLVSNSHAKNLAVATGIASAWADALTADASVWNSTSDLSQTVWLSQVATAGFFRPAFDATRGFGAGFTPLGAPLAETDYARAHYCADIRLNQLVDPAVQPGAGLIRAEVRVFWKRAGAITSVAPPANICDPSANPAASVDSNEAAYHFVYLTTAVAQTGTGG